MFEKLLNFLVYSPFYPHWLEFKKLNEGIDFTVSKYIGGRVLEVGAGTGERSKRFKSQYATKILEYVLTDYSSWDEEFKNKTNRSKIFGKLGSIFFSYSDVREKIDVVCSATDLPFEDESFDTHMSFEVLEHIDDPIMYMKEATRVLRKGGNIILCAPFLYRMHGGEPNHEHDYQRYAYGFYLEVAKKFNLEIIEIYSNTGIGTTSAILWNQFFIRKIMESGFSIKVLLIILSPIIFLVNQLVGYLIDIRSDKRFATRYHVVMKKL